MWLRQSSLLIESSSQYSLGTIPFREVMMYAHLPSVSGIDSSMSMVQSSSGLGVMMMNSLLL